MLKAGLGHADQLMPDAESPATLAIWSVQQLEAALYMHTLVPSCAHPWFTFPFHLFISMLSSQ